MLPMSKLKVLVIGGTGFIGSSLTKALVDSGYTAAVMGRKEAVSYPYHAEVPFIRADATRKGDWQQGIGNHDVIINLAGASIFRRWNPRGKREILESRLLSAANIIAALKSGKGNIHRLVSVSGVGYYGFCGDEPATEEQRPGTDFLATVAAVWEDAINQAQETGVNVVILRLGHVLGLGGGVLPKLLKLARWHLAAPWGTGNQWFSWIHEKDLVRCIIFIIENNEISGSVNVTSPCPVRNQELMKMLAHTTGRKVWVKSIPEALLKLVAGEFASVFLNGQRVVPDRLLGYGFQFDYVDLEHALNEFLKIENPVRE